MKLIKAIVRPSKVEEIKDALTRLNIAGMTITRSAGTRPAKRSRGDLPG